MKGTAKGLNNCKVGGLVTSGIWGLVTSGGKDESGGKVRCEDTTWLFGGGLAVDESGESSGVSLATTEAGELGEDWGEP